MNIGVIKKIIACAVFCCLVLTLVGITNEIVIDKVNNRYYILENCLEEADGSYQVQVYGSCHAYTSFNSKLLWDEYGVTSYVFANPGECIPTTYLRMLEQFKTDTPEVALVDIWGLNIYETYSAEERILSYYMPVNLELLPLSVEKLEVIQDFESLDLLLENFPLAKYKNRIMNMELNQVDFDYSVTGNLEISEGNIPVEMTLRRENNGFAAYTAAKDLVNYEQNQAKVSDTDVLAYEDIIMKYVEKIIDLCEEYDVELIFYRAPYISTENELKKSNWLAEYCEQKGILYFDLEKEICFDYSQDFIDYYHLNVSGAEKATQYLASYVLEAMN